MAGKSRESGKGILKGNFKEISKRNSKRISKRNSKENFKEKSKEESQDTDFKYIMLDAGNIYLGARFSYEELLEQEMLPFKVKAVIRHYLLKEAAPDTTLESQFYYLQRDTFLYDTFCQLRIRVKVNVRREKKSLGGKISYPYREKVLSLKELTETDAAGKMASGMIVREIILSKLGLMAFSV